MEACTAHEITPYSELYGLHPREFVFDHSFHMVPPTASWPPRFATVDEPEDVCCGDSDGDSEDEEGDEWILVRTL